MFVLPVRPCSLLPVQLSHVLIKSSSIFFERLRAQFKVVVSRIQARNVLGPAGTPALQTDYLARCIVQGYSTHRRNTGNLPRKIGRCHETSKLTGLDRVGLPRDEWFGSPWVVS